MLNPMKVIKDLDFVRLSGTEGEKKAVGIISEYLKQIGYKPKIEKFGLTGFEQGIANIEVNSKSYSATPFGLNKSAEIEGELVWLDNIKILEQNRGAYKGKILITYNFSRGMALKLKEAGVKGFIYAGRPLRKATSLSHRQSTYKSGYIDSVTVDHTTGIKLKKLSGKLIKLKIDQEVNEKKGYNIIVDIPGKGKDDTLTIAGGHLDSVAHSPGASDNGGGIVTLIKIAEYFKNCKLSRDLRLVFFGGEELGLLGSQNYVKKHLEELKKRLGLMLNIDVSGDALGIDHMAVIGNKELMGYIDGIIREKGYMFERRLDIYSSDCMPFSAYEFPSVSLARSGGKASMNIHTDGDNYRNVNPEGYTSCIKASIQILERIINAEIYPVDRKIDSSLREKIEKYLWNLNYEEPKLEWTEKYKE